MEEMGLLAQDGKIGRWFEEPDLPQEIASHVKMFTLDGKIHIFYEMQMHTMHCVYNPETKEYTPAVAMPYKHTMFAVGLVKNTLFALNINSGSNGRDIRIFDAVTGEWTEGTRSTVSFDSRSHAVGVGNKIYVLEQGLVYDVDMEEWGTFAPKPNGKPMPLGAYYSEVTVNGKIYAFGFGDSAIWMYDTATDIWSEGATLGIAIQYSAVAAHGKDIYIVGYSTSVENDKTIYRYDTEAGTYSTWIELPVSSRNSACSIAFVGDELYVAGGGSGVVRSMIRTNLNGGEEPGGQKLYMLMAVGEEQQLSVAEDLAENAQCAWSSSNEAVATVDGGGVVSAHAVGTADVRAASDADGYAEVIPVKVVAELGRKLAVHLAQNERQALWFAENGTVWSSANPGVATVDAEGVAEGVTTGLTRMNAQAAGGTGTIRVRVA